MDDFDDPKKLRQKADHYRRLYTILTDRRAAAEIMQISAQLEARALKIDAERRAKKVQAASKGQRGEDPASS